MASGRPAAIWRYRGRGSRSKNGLKFDFDRDDLLVEEVETGGAASLRNQCILAFDISDVALGSPRLWLILLLF